MSGAGHGPGGSPRSVPHWLAIAAAIATVIGVPIAIYAIVADPGDAAPHSPTTNSPTTSSPTQSASPPVTPASTPLTASPTPTHVPTPSPTSALPEPLKIEAVEIEFGESASGIGPGKYSLREQSKVNLHFWWTTHTNYGELDGKKCTVVAQTRNTATGSFVNGDSNYPTDVCSWKGWLAIQVPEGRYQVRVKVTTAGGSTRTGVASFTVVG
jgi:hypothetical protein